LFLPTAGTPGAGVSGSVSLTLPPGIAGGSSGPTMNLTSLMSEPAPSPVPPSSPFVDLAQAWPAQPPPLVPATPPPDAMAPIVLPGAGGESEILTSFMQMAPIAIGTLRRLLQSFSKADGPQSRLQILQEIFQRVNSLAANANLAGLHAIPQVGAVFEAFLQELCTTPAELNASTIQTTAKTIDFLSFLLQNGPAADPAEPMEAYILCVDDDPISLRASTCAVERANLKSVGVDEPQVALKLLECTPFDMVITDIDMPGMNGFELCSKLRTLPAHKHTPVIFVTALADFDSRALSVISGGNDLIAKPVMLMELAVKVVGFVIRAAIAKLPH
jgi:CheY-like chemotaxis protein